MPLQKQPVSINFQAGVETKKDPWQLAPGQFLSLVNSVFSKGGQLQKRNGYGPLASLPYAASYVTTFNGDLTAVGSNLQAFSTGTNSWYKKGQFQPLSLSTLPLIRNNTNQSQCDSAIAADGLICTVYTDQSLSNLSNPVYKYVIADSVTGQNIISPTIITGTHATLGTPRVFLLGGHFVIVYTTSASDLAYIAVSTSNPTIVKFQALISTSYTPSSSVSFDGAVFNNNLYLAWDGASSSGIKMAYLSSTLTLSASTNPDAAHSATTISVSIDAGNSVIWVSYYNSATSTGYTLAVNPLLSSILAPTEIITAGTILNITSSAQNGVNTIFYEVSNNYNYDSSIPTHFINSITCTQAGTVGAPATILRSVGLASKSFILDGVIYFLTTYQSPYQNTYFLTDSNGNLCAKVAYENGGGYLTTGLPSVSLSGDIAQIPYLIKDLIQAVNKNTNVPAGSQVAGIYSQTGINLVSFTINTDSAFSTEIGSNLNLTGGFLWGYDGYSITEQGFHLYPDSVELTTTSSGGDMSIQQYFYQVTYEWTDNQGNAFRSAPSIPVSITTTGSLSTVTVNVPTLRLTYKTSNPVKIVIYRWSTGQQVYYQTTSIELPILNSTTSDSVSFVDVNSDSTILGNNILYTTGGVVEDIGGPSFVNTFIFDDRLWGIDSEDQNLLWFSKQVIESTPVELSYLFTIYVNPNVGAQGPTGTLKCGLQMDDKAILFKATAINYFNGAGPDNTGASNQYSPPTFVTGTVGCSNPKSMVLQPNGIMFEFASEFGNQIWLLGRDLATSYIGAPVEELTKSATVQSAVSIPGTNYIVFTLDSGITLMYDYYYGQWGTFAGVPALSSTLFQGLHTYIDSSGGVFQETPGQYTDNANPVLLSYKTSWLNLAGLQGYQRAYFFFPLGKYLSPHKLNFGVAYDYNEGQYEYTLVTPTNYSLPYGGDVNYGAGTPYGGPGDKQQSRVFMQRKCESFQISMQEVFDPSFGVAPGAGFTMSGLNMIVGIKKGYRPVRAANSA